ncbi:MAG: type II toxin-antitoxin system PrlF family antitoxin [Trueperaceae bacterium]|nr:type II toxin-antitoxin system PrlF family antitoxin [Trueperaceae bacterium]
MTSKAQTTIPKAVRVALGLAEGDTLVYDIVDGQVVLRRLSEISVDDPFALFDEWDGDADRRAYAEL